MSKQAGPVVAEDIHLTYREKDRLRLRQLKKHHVSTILLHWFNALSWLFLLTTGAALLTSPYYRIMPQWFIDVVHGIFGGSANMLKFHIWLGVIWIVVITVYTIFGYRRYVRKLPVRTIKEERSIWHDRLMALQCLFFGNENLCLDKDDINWLRIRLLQMLKKTDEPLPPQGSFNATIWFVGSINDSRDYVNRFNYGLSYFARCGGVNDSCIHGGGLPGRKACILFHDYQLCA